MGSEPNSVSRSPATGARRADWAAGPGMAPSLLEKSGSCPMLGRPFSIRWAKGSCVIGSVIVRALPSCKQPEAAPYRFECGADCDVPQAIMSVLEKILVDSWTTETAKAWTDLWDTSATAMMKADPRHVLNAIAIG